MIYREDLLWYGNTTRFPVMRAANWALLHDRQCDSWLVGGTIFLKDDLILAQLFVI